MQFNCGLTKAEKLAIKQQNARERKAHLTEWHDYFVLWPRRMETEKHEIGLFGNWFSYKDLNDCRWLEWVERKGAPRTNLYGNDTGWYDWHYRAKDPPFKPRALEAEYVPLRCM